MRDGCIEVAVERVGGEGNYSFQVIALLGCLEKASDHRRERWRREDEERVGMEVVSLAPRGKEGTARVHSLVVKISNLPAGGFEDRNDERSESSGCGSRQALQVASSVHSSVTDAQVG